MIYTFDIYYRGKIDSKKLVMTVAKYFSNFCSNYEAGLIIPINKSADNNDRKGKLPEQDKDEFITDLVNWILDNSLDKDLFKLFLYNEQRTKETICPFDHHDDDCCWALNLSTDEFSKLQEKLTKNGLPIDVFYDNEKVVCIKSKGLAGFLGMQKCYTPREYEEYLKSKK